MIKSNTDKNRIILSIKKCENMGYAIKIATMLKDFVWGFKISDLSYGYLAGSTATTQLKPYGRIFVDLNIHCGPNDMANLITKIIEGKPEIISISASSGIQSIKQAVENRGSSEIFASTIPTFLNKEEVEEIYGGSLRLKVLQLTRWSLSGGVQGITCPGSEVQFLKNHEEFKDKDLKIIVSDVSSSKHKLDNDDQCNRIILSDAIRNGADHIVVGREVLESKDPIKAIKRIQKEIKAARKNSS